MLHTFRVRMLSTVRSIPRQSHSTCDVCRVMVASNKLINIQDSVELSTHATATVRDMVLGIGGTLYAARCTLHAGTYAPGRDRDRRLEV